MAELGLGTAQFGMAYGIKQDGQPTAEEVGHIIRTARKGGIRYLDTAAAYGNKNVLKPHITRDMRIVTKKQRDKSIVTSMEKMGVSTVHAILLHDPEDYKSIPALGELKKNGFCRKIGASIYTMQQLERLLEHTKPDILQLPLNVFDRRFVDFIGTRSLEIEIHLRSVFLQGALLMEPDTLPAHFVGVRHIFHRFHRDCRDYGVTPLQACLGYALSTFGADVVIVGCNSELQLRQLQKVKSCPWPVDYGITDENILNPSRWSV